MVNEMIVEVYTSKEGHPDRVAIAREGKVSVLPLDQKPVLTRNKSAVYLINRVAPTGHERVVRMAGIPPYLIEKLRPIELDDLPPSLPLGSDFDN